MIAYATKTSLTKVLRAKGQDIPSSRQAYFSRIRGRGYSLAWRDSDGQQHYASYTLWGYGPALYVDTVPLRITTEEAESYGLIRQ